MGLRLPLLSLLVAAALLPARQAPPAVRTLRLKVDTLPALGGGVDMDARQVTSDLEAFLAARGIRLLPAGKRAPEGAYELEVAPATLRYPEGTCLLSVNARLGPLPTEAHPAKDASRSWSAGFMAAQAGDEGLVYEARSVVLEMAALLLRQADPVGPPLPVQAPAVPAGGSPAQLPMPPQPRAMEVGSARVSVQPPPPAYPALGLERKVEGTVEVLLTIDPDGRPVRAVAAGGPHELKAAALRYAMQWIFEPVTAGGRPVWAQFRLPVPFRLRP